MKTLYDVVGVPRDASKFEIEECYQRALHADGATAHASGNTDAQRIKEACELLLNPVQRRNYDRQLKASVRAQRRVVANAAIKQDRVAVIALLVVLCCGQFCIAMLEKQYLDSESDQPASQAGSNLLRQARTQSTGH